LGLNSKNFTAFVGQFIRKTLKELEERPDKLDPETNKRFRRLLEDKWHLAVKTEGVPQLVHCDFNPKNILISRDHGSKVLGLIDWEFSDSGNGLIDFGNFFRFSYDYPEGARDRFIRGYKTVKPDLHPDWETGSR
jgi:thiamine kinase-like enzyme